MLGPFSTAKSPNKQHGNAKNVVLRKPQNGNSFTVQELKKESRASPANENLSCLSWQLKFSSLFACPQMTTKALRVLIWELQLNFSKQINL